MEKRKKDASLTKKKSRILTKIEGKYQKQDPLMSWCDSAFYSWTKTL